MHLKKNQTHPKLFHNKTPEVKNPLTWMKTLNPEKTCGVSENSCKKIFKKHLVSYIW